MPRDEKPVATLCAGEGVRRYPEPMVRADVLCGGWLGGGGYQPGRKRPANLQPESRKTMVLRG